MGKSNYDPKLVNILVVDDHDLIRKSIIKILTKKGYRNFVDCSNGSEAISLLSENSFDLVFCDLYMNKGDGFDVLSYLRNRTTNDDIPLIIVTGEAGKDDIVRVVDLGADDYMLKPFQTEELERKTHKALTKYHNPSPLLYHIRKAERLILKGELEDGHDHIKKAKKIDPLSARANHVLAIYHEKSGNIGKSVDTLKENIKENPTYLKNYTSIADIHIAGKNLAEAIKYMTSELDLNPKNVRRQIKIAQLLHKTDQYLPAIEHYRLALVENPRAKAALYGMGLSHAEAENLEKSFYYFKRARRAYPDYTKPLEAIVKYALDNKKEKAAEFVLIDEKKAHPRRLDTYVVLAKFYMAIDDSPAAIQTLEEALGKFPDNVDFLALKAKIEIQIKEFENAINTLKQLLKIQQSPQNMLLLSDVYNEILDFKSAIKLMEKLLSNPKTAPTGMAHIASTLTKDRQLVRSYYCHLRAWQLGFRTDMIDEGKRKLKEIIVSKRIKIKSKSKSKSKAKSKSSKAS